MLWKACGTVWLISAWQEKYFQKIDETLHFRHKKGTCEAVQKKRAKSPFLGFHDTMQGLIQTNKACDKIWGTRILRHLTHFLTCQSRIRFYPTLKTTDKLSTWLFMEEQNLCSTKMKRAFHILKQLEITRHVWGPKVVVNKDRRTKRTLDHYAFWRGKFLRHCLFLSLEITCHISVNI